MGITFLTQDNFTLENGGRSMTCDVPGVCIVLFKTDNCGYCDRFFPIYSKVSSKESRMTFACVDVNNNRNVVVMSKGTKVPIKAVPLILVYVNGRIKLKYNGDRSEASFSSFVQKALQETANDVQDVGISRSFMNNQQPASNTSATFGMPISSNNGGNRGGNNNQPGVNAGITKVPHNAPYLAYVGDF